MTDETRTRTSVAEARATGAAGDEAARPTSALQASRIPSTIGKYRVTGYLGRGGMGVVVAAKDTELQRAVALKLLAPGAWGETASARIEREAQAMAKLSHPNVVTVYEISRDSEHPFIAMELVAGVTLREWFRAEERSWRKTLAMVVAAGRGLAAAHAAGLVHRDFKPENVLVGADGRPRVTDFGLVATTVIAAETSDAEDGSSVVAGTPAYMSPEQWAGRDVDVRADQFAFAVTCWEALFGQRPYGSREMLEVSRSGSSREPERIRARRGVPRRIEAALRRAMHPDREARWPSLSELLERLERFGRDRRPALAAFAVVAVALTIAIVGFARSRSDDVMSVCRAAGEDVEEVWSAGRKRELAAAFTARPEGAGGTTWADVERSLDAWTADYREMRSQACQARRSGAPGADQLATARDRCLDRRRGELTALLAAFARPDATTVQYARAAARGLARPIACLAVQSDGAVLAEPPIAARDSLGGIRGQLAEASTRRALGKPLEALAIAETVAKEADALGWGPIIALSQLELALSLQAANKNEDGERAHARAALQADAAQDDETRFAAMIGLAIAGMNHSRYDESGEAIERARMIARRLPRDDRREVTLDIQESTLAFWRGDYDVCVTRGTATTERIAAVPGVSAIEGASLRLIIARCQFKKDQLAESEATLRAALAIAEEAVGRDHPVTAEIIFGLGYAAATQGKSDESLASFREALGIRERVLGPDNAVVGVSHTGVGDMLASMGRMAEAKESYARAIEILVPAWGADSPAVAIAEVGLGGVSHDLREYDEAEKHYGNALAILRAKRPSGHDEISSLLLSIGRTKLAKGDRGAIDVLQEAADAYAKQDERSLDAAATRYHLGRAIRDFENHDRGLAMIKEACATLEKAPDLWGLVRPCLVFLGKAPAPAPGPAR